MAQLYVRLTDELHAKLRVIAALRDDSLNGTVIEAVLQYVSDWEAKHGALPKPPQSS